MIHVKAFSWIGRSDLSWSDFFNQLYYSVPKVYILIQKHEKEAPVSLPWKDERGPSSIRRTVELFQRQPWGNFRETGWSTRFALIWLDCLGWLNVKKQITKICVWCFVLHWCRDLFCGLTWERAYMYVRKVLKCAFAFDWVLIILRWPCDRMLKSSYYHVYVALHEVTWLYGVHRSCRDGSSFMWHQLCQHCKYIALVNIQKCTIKKKLATHVESHASTASLLENRQRIALYISALYLIDQQQQQLQTTTACQKAAEKRSPDAGRGVSGQDRTQNCQLLRRVIICLLQWWWDLRIYPTFWWLEKKSE